MPMPTGAFPPFAQITHPNGIPLMPPPIMTVPSHTMPNQQNIQQHCKSCFHTSSFILDGWNPKKAIPFSLSRQRYCLTIQNRTRLSVNIL